MEFASECREEGPGEKFQEDEGVADQCFKRTSTKRHFCAVDAAAVVYDERKFPGMKTPLAP